VTGETDRSERKKSRAFTPSPAGYNREHGARALSTADEEELDRLSALLEAINQSLPESSPLQEGLAKAGLALSIAFVDGRRGWIENVYAHLDDPPTDEQRARLLRLGIDPDEN
jgi:hypothetical protein